MLLGIAKGYQGTWALSSVAGYYLLKIQTSFSPVLCFFGDIPRSRLGSTAAASLATTAPSIPLASLAVNWKCKSLASYFVICRS